MFRTNLRSGPILAASMQSLLCGLFSFRLSRQNFIYEAKKIEPDLLVSDRLTIQVGRSLQF